MRKNWKQYYIFISSTFLDMDAERDVIKFDVINRLNERYFAHRVNFQVIDLRAGINTENFSEDLREGRILDVCFDYIDSARPFFIGLLGERYGWIPSESLTSAVRERLPDNKRRLLGECKNVSVTEMEILYGAIGNNGENIDHCLFFYRQPESYNGIDEHVLVNYQDIVDGKPSATSAKKKEELHAKINNALVAHPEQWIEYKLYYDTQKQEFDGLDDFADLVYANMVEVIDSEMLVEQGRQRSWWEVERDTNEYIAEQYTFKKIDQSHNIKHNGQVVFLSGRHGAGKSTLLSHIYHNTTTLKHIAFIGMTSSGNSIREIMVRWLCELGETAWSNAMPDTESVPTIELFKMFKRHAEASGDTFFLDNIDALLGDDALLGWLSPNINIYITGSDSSLDQLKAIHNYIEHVNLGTLTIDEKQMFIENEELAHHFELPEKIKHELYNRDVTPCDISLALKLVTGLSAKDYAKIRGLGGNIDAINDYLYNIYRESITSNVGCFRYTFERFAKNVCENESVIKAFAYIGMSRIGLRASDITNLLNEQWDPVSFSKATNYFGDFLISDPETKKWKFKSLDFATQMASALDEAEGYRTLVECMCRYPDTDCIKREVLLYYIIKSHLSTDGIKYLSTLEHYTLDETPEWYATPLDLLKDEPQFVDDIEACCSQMTNGEKASFLSLLLDNGMKFTESMDLYVKVVERCLSTVKIEELAENQAFAVGWMWIHTCQYAKYWLKLGNNVKMLSAQSALDAFRRCVELNPSNAKAKTMITAAVSQLMDVYTELGAVNKVMELYTKYGTTV